MLVCGVEVDMETIYQKYKNQKVKMVAEVKQVSGAGLKEAKEAVDVFWEQKNGISSKNNAIVPENGRESLPDGDRKSVV